jgi:hypothetical protein
VLALLVAVCFVFQLRKIDLTTADLGRHLKNGEVFFNTGTVVSGNYYSYTHPEHPTVNHHWGTGVVFYAIYYLFGFKGVSLFHALLGALAFGLALRVGLGRGPAWAVALAGAAVLPLFATRAEVRPEAFSYVFIALYLLLLERHSAGRLSTRQLLVWLGVCQLLWVNLHLFFAFGWAIVGAFALAASLRKCPQARGLWVALGVVAAVSFANPAGLEGWLQPLTIFREYGYRIAENQTVPFMLHRYWVLLDHGGGFQPMWPYFLFVGLSLVLLGLAVWAGLRARAAFGPALPLWLVVAGFVGIAWLVNRGFPMAALTSIPLLAWAAAQWRGPRWLPIAGLATAAGLLLVGLAWPNSLYSPLKYTGADTPPNRLWLTGPGLFQHNQGQVVVDVNACASFLKAYNIQGPILNNYDIGGYLIFHLYPQHRVFVDNRPEAYPLSFFNDVYYPLQADETAWRRVDSLYRFNAIVFMRHDMTDHAQPFLIRRVQDSQVWAPVFVDDFTIILLRRSPPNALAIQQWEPRIRPLLQVP